MKDMQRRNPEAAELRTRAAQFQREGWSKPSRAAADYSRGMSDGG